MWNAHLPQILKASQYELDETNVLQDYTAQVLQLVSSRLLKGIKTLPTSQWVEVDRIMALLQARMHYLQNPSQYASNSTEIPRKIRITIMGGSVLVGRNCRSVRKEMKWEFSMPNRLCTWSRRLETLVNNLLGDIVEIYPLALGGTNTETGTTILSLQLQPDLHPDIIINGYSTNDMHINTIKDANQANQTLRDRTFSLMQNFVRTVLRKCSQTRPLLIHVNDYLGNEQREIYATTEYAQGIGVLANYYGFASLSYADLVRDLVYADTHEQWFSPPGWYLGKKKMEREIHPVMSMHMATAYLSMFSLLHTAISYCSMTPGARAQVLNASLAGTEIPYMPKDGGLPEMTTKVPGHKPVMPYWSLPPPLTTDLNLEDVSALWKKSADQPEPCPLEPRCIFAWIYGLSRDTNDMEKVHERFMNHTTVNLGWRLMEDGGKWGWIPWMGRRSKWVLDFKNATQPLRSVSLLYMRSYGAKWEHSTLQLSAYSRPTSNDEWKHLSEEKLHGVHAKNTSETYTHELILEKENGIGSDLRIQLELVNGTTFKVSGLAVCS